MNETDQLRMERKRAELEIEMSTAECFMSRLLDLRRQHDRAPTKQLAVRIDEALPGLRRAFMRCHELMWDIEEIMLRRYEGKFLSPEAARAVRDAQKDQLRALQQRSAGVFHEYHVALKA